MRARAFCISREVAGTFGRRAHLSTASFEARAAAYWTADRIGHLTQGKDLALAPNKPGVAVLLRVIGLLGADGTLSESTHARKKLTQASGMVLTLEPVARLISGLRPRPG